MATDTLTSPTIMGSATRPKVYKNFIDGEWVKSSSGETFENRNPADTRDLVGIFQKSGKADVAAVDPPRHSRHGAAGQPGIGIGPENGVQRLPGTQAEYPGRPRPDPHQPRRRAIRRAERRGDLYRGAQPALIAAETPRREHAEQAGVDSAVFTSSEIRRSASIGPACSRSSDWRPIARATNSVRSGTEVRVELPVSWVTWWETPRSPFLICRRP